MANGIQFNSRSPDYKFENVELSWENIVVEGSTYRVRGEASAMHHFLFLTLQVAIFAYNTSSKTEFEKLHDMYNELPAPKGGLIQFDSVKIPADRYPIVVVGCTFEGRYKNHGGEREVFEQDVAKFIDEHPGCTSAGNCVVDEEKNENVELAFVKATELFHLLGAKARPATPTMYMSRRLPPAETGNDRKTSRLGRVWDILKRRRR
jgi:hypothetical protein